jgi:hypothetical protein
MTESYIIIELAGLAHGKMIGVGLEEPVCVSVDFCHS